MSTTLQDANISGLKFYEPSAATNTKTLNGQSTQELQQNFLKMLTVQLQNQDPMNPMESAEMTSQLAQLNMVDGINSMNKSMQTLVSQIQMSDFVSQASTVGRSAMVATNKISFDGVNGVVLGANFESPVAETVIKITDSTGNQVLNRQLGSSPSGMSNFYWDGLDSYGQPLQGGTYYLQISGKNADKNVLSQAMVASVVTAVARDGNNLKLSLSSGSQVSAADVKQWVLQ
jgi:flagellar basal-body rod modification protein FlgD